MEYVKNHSWDYTLTDDYTITVDNMEFGNFDAYSLDGQLLIQGLGKTLKIKKGYSWDGCTGVPSYPWNLEASLVHDVLYQVKKNPNGELCKATWWQVDNLFKAMMQNAGASWLQRTTYYLGVRTFGYFFKLEKFNSLIIKAV